MHRPVSAAAAAALALGIAAGAAAQEPSGPASGTVPAPAVAAEVERIAGALRLWPGFEPLTIPLAVYDGDRTWLFRHPAPPAGFDRVAGSASQAYAMPGRHPAVTSNTSADIGGTTSATVMAAGSRASATALAAVALHEGFHVFQRARHPGWVANEADMLRYPADDAGLLALRRLETELLRRALADRSGAACLAARALDVRAVRFARMDSAFAAYERLNELNEGLAQYVQLRAAGLDDVEIPAGGFPPAEVRARIYAVGPALAFLLDRFRPGWAELLESGDSRAPDQLLAQALAGASRAGCAPDPADSIRVVRTAHADAAAESARRTALRDAFDRRAGWRVVIEAAPGSPLWPQGFDPLNVLAVDGGLLHRRFLRLGNDAGTLELLRDGGAAPEALTLAAGAHPLFEGVRRVVIAGLGRPEVSRAGSRVTLRVPGLTAELETASVEETGSTLIIRLPAAD